MTEIPEHLRKRAEEARAKADAAKAASEVPAGETPTTDADAGAADAPTSEAASRIPAHLLERSRAAKARSEGGGGGSGGGDDGGSEGGGGVAVAERPSTAAVPAAGLPVGAGPGGHTQRLLTVVKAGSIQDVKAEPQDKVHVWPHLLVIEFASILILLAGVTIFSALVRAPLLGLADFNKTPTPSKAPWYFLGLQELLTMFHPMVAGVTIPGIALFLLMVAPFVDKNPSNKPKDRKFAISIFTLFMVMWAVLVIIGSFFRGPGFNFIFPWNDGIFFEL